MYTASQEHRSRKETGVTFRATTLLIALSLSVPAVAQEQPGGRAAPLPKSGQAPAPQGGGGTLKPTEPVVTAFLTGLGALKYCGFGGKEGLAILELHYGLKPDTIDRALSTRILQGIETQVRQDRQQFCDRAWQRYGINGRDFRGLLTVPGATEASGWTIEPYPAGGPVTYCHAYRQRETGMMEFIYRNPDGIEFSLSSPKLKLKPSEAQQLAVEFGSVTRRVVSTGPGEDEISFALGKDLLDLLQRSQGFTLRAHGTSLAVPLNGQAEIIDKLDACLKANASRRARQ
jgi:hypothetical protein